MPTAIEKTLDALLSGDLQGVNKKSTKTSHVRGTIKGFLPVKSKPKPPPISQPISLLDPESGDTNTKEEAKAEKALQPPERFNPVVIEDEDILIDPTSTQTETAILQPGEGGIAQPQQEPTGANLPTGGGPSGGQPSQVGGLSGGPLATAQGTVPQGDTTPGPAASSIGSGNGTSEPGASSQSGGPLSTQSGGLAGTTFPINAPDQTFPTGEGGDPQFKTLTDEQRQTLLQSDILDVLLKTEAGRLLLGDRRQKELQAERTLQILSKQPSKEQVKIREIKFESDQLKRAAFPQLEQMKFAKESNLFQSVNKQKSE